MTDGESATLLEGDLARWDATTDLVVVRMSVAGACAATEGADAGGEALVGGRTAALFCGQGYPSGGISLADASLFGRPGARSALDA